jgi:hypothetical protein
MWYRSWSLATIITLEFMTRKERTAINYSYSICARKNRYKITPASERIPDEI